MAKRRSMPTGIAAPVTDAAHPTEVTVTPTVSEATLVAPSAASAPAPTAAASDSKQSRLVAMLRRPEGATVAELMAVTGWMSHSVRGALSAVIKRKLGLAVDSRLEVDRGRVYRITPPPPVTKPAAGRRKAKPAAVHAGASSAAA